MTLQVQDLHRVDLVVDLHQQSDERSPQHDVLVVLPSLLLQELLLRELCLVLEGLAVLNDFLHDLHPVNPVLAHLVHLGPRLGYPPRSHRA